MLRRLCVHSVAPQSGHLAAGATGNPHVGCHLVMRVTPLSVPTIIYLMESNSSVSLSPTKVANQHAPSWAHNNNDCSRAQHPRAVGYRSKAAKPAVLPGSISESWKTSGIVGCVGAQAIPTPSTPSPPPPNPHPPGSPPRKSHVGLAFRFPASRPPISTLQARQLRIP